MQPFIISQLVFIKLNIRKLNYSIHHNNGCSNYSFIVISKHCQCIHQIVIYLGCAQWDLRAYMFSLSTSSANSSQSSSTVVERSGIHKHLCALSLLLSRASSWWSTLKWDLPKYLCKYASISPPSFST